VPHPDPFLGAKLFIVDGRNVLGAMRGAGGDLPAQALIARLWTAVGTKTRIVVVFDGIRDGGAIIPERSSRLGVRWSRHESADDVIVRMVADAPNGTLVATDDIELGQRTRALGATTVRSRQLVERFARQHTAAPSVGAARPPRPAASQVAEAARDDDPALPAWKPGRGATRKTGNPKRGRPQGRPPAGGR
jgi:predicted RNA-binding protein with PIN domain